MGVKSEEREIEKTQKKARWKIDSIINLVFLDNNHLNN